MTATLPRRPLLWSAAGAACLLALSTALAPQARSEATPPVPAAQLAAVKKTLADPPAMCAAGYVVLTIDDGPSPIYTNPLLDFLVERRVPATFFVQGVRVTAYPKPTQRAAGLGFTIGNHTWDHAHLPLLSDAQVAVELTRTRDALRVLGIDSGVLMRAPYGEDTAHDVALINAIGMTPIGWTDDSQDWRGGGPADIAARVTAQLLPTKVNVVLIHDGIDGPDPRGRVVAAQSLQAIPLVVDTARKAGYCFTEFGSNGQPMVPAPSWTDHGWVAPR